VINITIKKFILNRKKKKSVRTGRERCDLFFPIPLSPCQILHASDYVPSSTRRVHGFNQILRGFETQKELRPLF